MMLTSVVVALTIANVYSFSMKDIFGEGCCGDSRPVEPEAISRPLLIESYIETASRIPEYHPIIKGMLTIHIISQFHAQSIF